MKTRKLQNSKFIRQETTQPYTHRIANSDRKDGWLVVVQAISVGGLVFGLKFAKLSLCTRKLI